MTLLLRFKAWLRNWLLVDSTVGAEQLTSRPATIEDGAAQLVERARAGDQNAMAMLAEIGQRAKQGVPRAIKSRKAIEIYIRKHPYKEANFGGEDLDVDAFCEAAQASFAGEYVETVTTKIPEIASHSLNKAIVTVANGPELDKSKLIAVRSTMSDDDKAAFMLGYNQGMSELNDVPRALQSAYILGHILGTARRIQAVRLPDVPVSVLCPSLGTELGE